MYGCQPPRELKSIDLQVVKDGGGENCSRLFLNWILVRIADKFRWFIRSLAAYLSRVLPPSGSLSVCQGEKLSPQQIGILQLASRKKVLQKRWCFCRKKIQVYKRYTECFSLCQLLQLHPSQRDTSFQFAVNQISSLWCRGSPTISPSEKIFIS